MLASLSGMKNGSHWRPSLLTVKTRAFLESGMSEPIAEEQKPTIVFDGDVCTQLISGAERLFKMGASDIRIQSDDFVFAYINRAWVKSSNRRLEDGELRAIVCHLYGGQSGLGVLGDGKPLDFDAVMQPDPDNDPDRTLRCRANITGSRVGIVANGVSIVLRTIPDLPMKWEKMNVEPEITEAFFPSQGLALVVGITGSGKSTFLSSSVGYRIEVLKQPIAIGTFEDPIEYVFTRLPLGSMPEVSQIQIGRNLSSFNLVAPNVLRRKYDVVLVGEMRDKLSIETALLIADSGHATYGTLHAETPATAFTRVISEFPVEQQPSVAIKMLENIKIIVAQKIERTIAGKGLAVRSWCVFDRALKETLGDHPYPKWARLIREHMNRNGTSFEERSWPLYRDNIISLDVFMRFSGMNLREARAYLLTKGIEC
jgi:defect-in-organelle-trafficking protein DotB